MAEVKEEKSFKDTLNLPETTLAMRANAAVREVEIQKFWEDNNIYQKMLEKNKGNKSFILHDGPPYLSSDKIHIGHALNKILKDIVLKNEQNNKNINNNITDNELNDKFFKLKSTQILKILDIINIDCNSNYKFKRFESSTSNLENNLNDKKKVSTIDDFEILDKVSDLESDILFNPINIYEDLKKNVSKVMIYFLRSEVIN